MNVQHTPVNLVSLRERGTALLVCSTVYLPLCGIALIAALVVASVVRAGQGVPGEDSSVFLYVGHELLTGQVPYRDVWDHKPPGVYFADALGLWLGQGSLWGVWVLEWASLAAAAALSYRAFARSFGTVPALFGTTAWVCSVPLVCNGGNVTEEWALLPATALLAAFTRWHAEALSWRAAAIIGVCGAGLLLCKQTTIGLFASALLTICLIRLRGRQHDWLLREVGAALAGFGAICGVVLGYFTAMGAVPALWDQVVRYNAVYGQSDMHSRLLALVAGWSVLSVSGIAGLALAGWILLLASWCGQRALPPLAILALLDLPLDGGLGALPGRVTRGYFHYFLTWLPELGLLCAILLVMCLQSRPRAPFVMIAASICAGTQVALSPLVPGFLGGVALTGLRYMPFLIPVAMLAAAGAQRLEKRPRRTVPISIAVGGTMLLAGSWAGLQGSTYPANQGSATGLPPITAYIDCHARPDETLLVWGAFPWLNLVSGCAAPTAYVYQTPLFTRDYTSDEQVNRFLADLRRRPPALIVDVAADTGFVPQLDSTWNPGAQTYGIVPADRRIHSFILAHYRPPLHRSSDRWTIYRPVKR